MILFGNGDERARAWIDQAVDRGLKLVVPAPVLAQVWRNGARQVWLARLLNDVAVAPFDAMVARRTGELLARTGTADVVDAAVAVTAAAQGHHVLTTDPDDLTVLVGAFRGLRLLTVTD